MNSGDDLTIDVWWEADCGATHLERNPAVVEYHCPSQINVTVSYEGAPDDSQLGPTPLT